jgi:hypothetical protein
VLRLFDNIIFFFKDRQNLLHFLDKKKNGSVYRGSDGYPIEKINEGDGDCVVVKNGVLHGASCDQPAYFACEYKYSCKKIAIGVYLKQQLIPAHH